MFNKLIANILPFMPQKLIWVFSKRYIAGETINDGIVVSRKLNKEGIKVTVDLLGEFIKTIDQAEINKNLYLEIIDRFTEEKINGSFSLKPTMFGLLIDEDKCYHFVDEIVAKASNKNRFVRIDMEDSQCVDKEIRLYTKLLKKYPSNVGLVFQSYLHRTYNDLTELKQYQLNGTPINIRLCKGIYDESEKIAFKNYEEIQKQYVYDLKYMFENGIYVAIATHDKYLVEQALELIEQYQIPQNMYEFQMLYGVTPELRKSIIDKGHKMRVYVPFGKEWFGYSTRRLKENPQIASHIIKALFVRG